MENHPKHEGEAYADPFRMKHKQLPGVYKLISVINLPLSLSYKQFEK